MEAIAIIACTATGLACSARALPIWPAPWLAKKPLACALCMAFHATWVVMLVMMAAGFLTLSKGEALSTLFASTGLATFMCAQTGLFAPPLDLS